MAGSFTSGRFRFQVESSDWESASARGFYRDLDDDEFDLRLSDTGKVPDLAGAPIASWLLARLARLTDDRLGLGGVEYSDGGGYMVEFVVNLLPAAPVSRKASSVQPLLFEMDEPVPRVEPE